MADVNLRTTQAGRRLLAAARFRPSTGTVADWRRRSRRRGRPSVFGWGLSGPARGQKTMALRPRRAAQGAPACERGAVTVDTSGTSHCHGPGAVTVASPGAGSPAVCGTSMNVALLWCLPIGGATRLRVGAKSGLTTSKCSA